jgi:hypothetical protein
MWSLELVATKGDAGNTQCRVHPASDFLRYLFFYGTIADASLEYKLSTLVEFTAVTT